VIFPAALYFTDIIGLFELTKGTALKYAGQNKIDGFDNPDLIVKRTHAAIGFELYATMY